MKKTYINPEMVIVKVQTQQMLAGSITEYLKDNIGNGFTQHGREFDFEDDLEDDLEDDFEDEEEE